MKTREQLECCRVKPSTTAMAATAALVGYEGGEGLLTPQYIEDEHGVYSTGMFHYKGKQIIITIDDGLWHLSASANHTLGYYELKELRYEFMPDDMTVAQIFPPPRVVRQPARELLPPVAAPARSLQRGAG